MAASMGTLSKSVREMRVEVVQMGARGYLQLMDYYRSLMNLVRKQSLETSSPECGTCSINGRHKGKQFCHFRLVAVRKFREHSLYSRLVCLEHTFKKFAEHQCKKCMGEP